MTLEWAYMYIHVIMYMYIIQSTCWTHSTWSSTWPFKHEATIYGVVLCSIKYFTQTREEGRVGGGGGGGRGQQFHQNIYSTSQKNVSDCRELFLQHYCATVVEYSAQCNTSLR